MFDIGFWEILLIGIVMLLVVGPQRLPGLAVFAGHWIGRLRRFARNMRDEINEELETEHLKSLVEEQNREINELRRDVEAVRGDTERSFREAEEEVRDAGRTDTADAGSDDARRAGDGSDRERGGEDDKDTRGGSEDPAAAAQAEPSDEGPDSERGDGKR